MMEFNNAKSFICSHFENRYETYIKYTLEFAKLEGLWLEFGVATGQTTSKYVDYMPQSNKPIYGFDSFEGIPENWAEHPKGTFTTHGKVPQITGAEIIVGWFENTLPNFIRDKGRPISVLIVDCDVYSSTKTIFDNCKNLIVPGTVIIFDEIYNYPTYQDHEYKAFLEFVKEKNVEYEWIAYVENGEQASCLIKSIDN